MSTRGGQQSRLIAPAIGPAELLAVFVGGMVGSAGRWAVGRLFAGPQANLGSTLLVNLSGAFALGLLLSWLAGWPDGRRVRKLRLLLGTGVLGAWTSYSALAVGTLQAIEVSVWLAAGNLGLTLGAGLACCGLGIWLGRRWRPAGVAP